MNDLTIVLVLLLIFMWKLDFITILLNLKNLSSKVPDEFKDVFDQEKYEKSQKYTRANSKFELISALMDLFLLLTFWLCGGFVWLNNIVVNLGFGTVLSGSIYLGALAIAQTMLSIPFNLYRTFILEKRFGFNKTTPALYFQDQLKGLLLTVIIGAPILALILWIFSSVSNAWLWAWIVVTAFSLLMTYLAPSFILPLFNKFTPLQDGELKDAINEMARKCNFPLTELFVIDGSKRSTKANAYFTGFGKLKKIALYDTLIEKQTKEELVAVLAHEIGHFKKKHIVQRMCLSVIQTGIIFYLLGLFTTPNTVISETIYEAFGFISNQPLYVDNQPTKKDVL